VNRPTFHERYPALGDETTHMPGGHTEVIGALLESRGVSRRGNG
jgi:hypothetical protein